MKDAKRLVVTLDCLERAGLTALAKRERRDVRAQAAVIIRRELLKRGLLPVVATGHARQEVRV